MQVSGANDYRLQDQVLESILAAPSAANYGHAKQGMVKQVQQGLMLVGPNSSAQLEAVWHTTVGSLQSQVHQPIHKSSMLKISQTALQAAAGIDLIPCCNKLCHATSWPDSNVCHGMCTECFMTSTLLLPGRMCTSIACCGDRQRLMLALAGGCTYHSSSLGTKLLKQRVQTVTTPCLQPSSLFIRY